MNHTPLVLLADDDEALVKALKIRLEHVGVNVITAHDGYTSLAKANSEQPDVMILDVNMPAGDGFSVLERMNQASGVSHIPVIYLTGDQSERLDQIAQDLGAIALFHKPFELNDLIKSVWAAMRPRAA